MSPLADPLSFHPEQDTRGNGGAFFGGRCAVGLAVVLLALLSLTTVTRWWPADAAFPVERIIQQPVAPETSTFSSQTPDLTAPDPGDAPP